MYCMCAMREGKLKDLFFTIIIKQPRINLVIKHQNKNVIRDKKWQMTIFMAGTFSQLAHHQQAWQKTVSGKKKKSYITNICTSKAWLLAFTETRKANRVFNTSQRKTDTSTAAERCRNTHAHTFYVHYIGTFHICHSNIFPERTEKKWRRDKGRKRVRPP